jgi:protein CpxP
MSILPELKRLIIVTSLVLAWPLGTLADSPPAAGPDHGADGPAHKHEMPGCGMAGGFAHGDMMDREEMAGADGWVPPSLGRLQLSEAQEDKIFAIMHAEAPQARELGKAIRNAHRGLHELATAAKYDEAKTKVLADALGKALSESALLRARTHHQIYEVLTPEQRQALEGHAQHGGGEHGPRYHEEHPPTTPK